VISVLDQAVSSLSNFAASIVAASQLPAADFGRFSLLFAAYLIANGVVRGCVSEPLIVRHSAEADQIRPSQLAEAVGVSCVLGLAAGVALAAIAFVDPFAGFGPMIGLAVCMSGLAAQDSIRYVFFVVGRPLGALIDDGFWLLGVGIGLAAFVTSGVRLTLLNVSLLWAVSGVVAAGLSGRRLLFGGLFRPTELLSSVRTWLGKHRDIYPQFVGDFLAMQLGGPISLFAVSGISGFKAVAALRGAQLLFNPLTVLVNGARVGVIPELVRARHKSAGLWRRRGFQIGCFVAGICAVWVVTVLTLPDVVGHAILGYSWVDAKALLVPTGLATIGLGISAVQFAAVRSLADATGSLRARLSSACAATLGTVGGAYLNGALGAALGNAFATPLIIVVWGIQVRISARRKLVGREGKT
jgi:hypothetical protein